MTIPVEQWTPAMLADAEAIRALKARYFRYVDTKQWAALADLFTEDATIHFVQRTDEPEALAVAIARISGTLQPGATSVHHGTMPEITILSEDEAAAIWSMTDILVFPEDRPNPLGLRRLEGHGHYHDRYVRRDGLWRIASLRLERLLVEQDLRPGGAGE